MSRCTTGLVHSLLLDTTPKPLKAEKNEKKNKNITKNKTDFEGAEKNAVRDLSSGIGVGGGAETF